MNGLAGADVYRWVEFFELRNVMKRNAERTGRSHVCLGALPDRLEHDEEHGITYFSFDGVEYAYIRHGRVSERRGEVAVLYENDGAASRGMAYTDGRGVEALRIARGRPVVGSPEWN